VTAAVIRDLVVVCQGAAGLAAALSAADEARARGQSVRITLIDKATESDAGGNTRWSPSYMRMSAPDCLEPSFVQDMLAATQFKGDEAFSPGAGRPATIA
jgi:tricarballylate dehydrogenase